MFQDSLALFKDSLEILLDFLGYFSGLFEIFDDLKDSFEILLDVSGFFGIFQRFF